MRSSDCNTIIMSLLPKYVKIFFLFSKEKCSDLKNWAHLRSFASPNIWPVTVQACNTKKLYQELGLEPLQNSHMLGRLCSFYKIYKYLIPMSW